MNTWFTRLAAGAFAVAFLGLTACKKDETQVVAQMAGAPALTVSTTAPDLVLTEQNAETTGAAFTYTAANFGYPAVVTYTVQVDKPGNNFANPQTFSAGTTAGTLTLTKSQLANAFFKLKYASGVTSKVEARVVASIDNSATSYQPSQTFTLTATPTQACISNKYGNWSVIGPAGVDWNTDKALTYDCFTQTYTARMTLNVGEFKFRQNNAWAVNLGGASTGSTDLSKGANLATNGANLKINTAGTYNIVLSVSGAGGVVSGGTATITP